VRNRSGLYPRLAVDGQGKKVVSGAGGVLLTRTAATVGLVAGLSAALAPWRRPLTRHDPGKVLLDLAISLALGGDCLADIAQLRAHPQVFGPVASDPTVSRLMDTLAADAPRRWRRLTPPARPPAPAPGRWPACTPPTTTSTRPGRWSSTWTPRWSRHIRRRSRPHRRSSAASASTRCAVRR
jgi:hypothetical protein